MNARLPRREAGALLLTVILVLATVAAMAFGLSRGAGAGAHSVASEYERRSNAYLLQGGLAAGRWAYQVNKCAVANVAAFPLGGASVSATTTKVPGGASVTASASTATQSKITQTRTFTLFDLNTAPEAKIVNGATSDATIAYGVQAAQGSDTAATLKLASGPAGPTSNALLYWGLNEIPADSLILSAIVTLSANGSGGNGLIVNAQRVTTQWDAKAATWTVARGGANPTTWAGGNYAASQVASAAVSNGAYTIDVTGLMDGWFSGTLLNDGMLLSLAKANQQVSFYGSVGTNTNSQRPMLAASFAKKCK
jgi:hypothetical protein